MHKKTNLINRSSSRKESSLSVIEKTDNEVKKHSFAQTKRIKNADSDFKRYQHRLEAQGKELRCLYNQLEKYQNKYLNLFEFSPVGYLVCDKNGLINEVNRTAASKLGVKKNNLIMTPLYHYIDRFYSDLFQKQLKKTFKTGISQQSELKMKKNDRESFYVKLETMITHEENNICRFCIITLSDITDTRDSENKKIRKSKVLGSILDSLGNPFYIINATDYTVEMINSAAKLDLSEETPTCFSLLGKKKPCNNPNTPCPVYKAKKTKKPVVLEHVIRKRGKKRYFEVHGFPVLDNKGNVKKVLKYSYDITARKHLKDEQSMAAKVFENLKESIIVTDEDAKIRFVNPAFTSITGYEAKEAIGKDIRMIAPHNYDSTFYKKIWSSVYKNGQWQGEIWNKKKNNEVFPQWMNFTHIEDPDEKTKHYLAVSRDITDMKKNEDKLKHQAYHDPLTGLPNRNLFRDRVNHAIARSRRKKSTLAVMFLDLDNFKYINDSLGHRAGDLLLKSLSRKLKKCLRSDDTVSRIGGDEFTILMEEVNNSKDAIIPAEKIIDLFSNPIPLIGHKIHITASIGVAFCPVDAKSYEKLIRNADLAMYYAKEHGKNKYQFYCKGMNNKLTGCYKINSMRKN